MNYDDSKDQKSYQLKKNTLAHAAEYAAEYAGNFNINQKKVTSNHCCYLYYIRQNQWKKVKNNSLFL